MDPTRFDRLTATLATSGTRRALTRLLLGLPLLAGGLTPLRDSDDATAQQDDDHGSSHRQHRRKARHRHQTGKDKENRKGKRKGKRKNTGSTPPPPAAPQTVTVTCPGDTGAGIFGGPRRYAQTFTAPISGQLTAAQIEIGVLSPEGDFTAEIRTVDGTGTPTTTVLASTRIENVPHTPSPFRVPLNITFAAPASVQAGTAYALVVAIDAGQGFQLWIRGGDVCPGQLFSALGDTDPFFRHTSLDMIFSVTIVG